VAAPPLAKDERDETVAPTAAEVGETAEGGAGSGPAGSSVMGRVVLVVAAVVAGLLMVEVLRLRRRARLLLMPAG
jgi:hypothetical protein